MACVLDVAEYILSKCGPMTTMKLQKLVYYCQAWSLVWDSHPLFEERIEAWANGPVVPDLYNAHRGQFTVLTVGGNASALDKDAIETIDAVLDFYGNRDAQWLSDLTHQEDPWRNARRGLAPGEPSSREIKHAELAEYYMGLVLQ
jgi:uncharacterized phage-associated protein